MGRKRCTKWDEGKVINNSNFVHISEKVNGLQLFEIGKELTTDVGEAVAIMMRNKDLDERVWGLSFEFNMDEIETTKCLYWLSGGDNEWTTLHNYRNSWKDCCWEYRDRFGERVIEIIESAKTLGDIKSGFLKYLNLPILYDFALEKDLIR